MIQLKLLIVTPFIMLFTHQLAVFPHEYAHSFTAWLLGFKTNPLALDYGGTSWLNLFLLIHIDENVNYAMIAARGSKHAVALIAFAGAGIANGSLYLISLYLLSKQYLQQRVLLYYAMFWFNFMNLANFYDYIPVRTFADHGDMAHVAKGLGISPWWIYLVGGYLVAWIIWHFFTHTLIRAFIYLKLTSTPARAALTITCILPLLGYFGMAGISGYGEISHLLSVTSFIAIPGFIMACWPTRAWVQRQINILSH
jgi:hypothetical protein